MMNFFAWYIPATVVAALWSLANFQRQVSAECAPDSFGKIPPGEENSYEYAVVIDAGSSGSKLHVYGWKKEDNRLQLPNFLRVFCDRFSPGFPSLNGNKDYKEHVHALLKAAKDHVPKSVYSETPIYFLGTAGMRLMEEKRVNQATDFVDQMLHNPNENPFYYPPHAKARVLSGEEEGIFLWIAANYLQKVFTPDEDTETITTFGNLDLGSGSTHIAFAPRGNILANKFPVRLAGTRFNLYVHSYLGYGQNEVAKWIRNQLYKKSPASSVNDPCLLRGHSLTEVIDEKTITFKGKGEPEDCLQLLEGLIYQPADPSQCNPKPCGIGSTYQPPIQDTKDFYVMGDFIYPLKSMDVLKDEGKFSLEDLKNAAIKFCGTSVDDLATKLKKTADNLSKDCLTGLYIPLLFEKGYGFKADTTQLKTPDTLDDPEIDWTRGCVIYENERQRCEATA